MVVSAKQEATTALERVLSAGQIVTNRIQLLTYEADGGFDHHLPDAVAFPAAPGDVVALVRWANEHHVPLVARGAGTGLSGGAIAEQGGVIVEFSRMKRVIELDEAGRSAVVEPGVVNLVLDELCKTRGLYFPPDPASGRVATLGGNIAENAGGPHCFKYGVTSNYVMELDVVLADGRLVRLGGRAFDYPEYDLVGVLTGSEGTLGIITRASVRLIRNAPAVRTLMVSFDSMAQAGKAVSAIIARGLVPATLEMMDQQIMRIVEDYAHAGLPVEFAGALIIETDGYAESVSPQMEEISEILREHGGHNLRLARTAEERDKIWYARKSVGGALSRIAPAYLPVDGTVPRSKIAETLAEITAMCDGFHVPVAYILHGGDGNFHPHLFIMDPGDKELVARAFQAARETMAICVKQGGSITGEHGVGTEKRNGMPLMYNADELAAMQDVKEVFDPAQLLNPGKIFLEQTSPREVRSVQAGDTAPSGAIAPISTQEASAAIRACGAANPPRRIRILGSGTWSSQRATIDLCLTTQALTGILEYAPEDLYVRVGAGTSLARLQGVLHKDGMWVPLVSPWADSTVGGIVASNFNAPLRMRYGGLRDQVLAVTAVLGDGRIIRAGRPVVKNVAGYDLTKLFVGSYGTLGLVTEVTFKISALPRTVRTLVVPVDDLTRGIRLASRLYSLSLVASAILLCQACQIPGADAPYVLAYTAEGLEQDVFAELGLTRQAVESESLAGVTEQTASGSEWWAAWLGSASPETTTMRVGVPPKEVLQVLETLMQMWGDATFMADVANGQVYAHGSFDIPAVRQVALEHEGYAIVLSAPHGDSREVDRWGYRPDALDVMRKLKARWDPQGVLNPGAFVVHSKPD